MCQLRGLSILKGRSWSICPLGLGGSQVAIELVDWNAELRQSCAMARNS